MDKEKNVQMVPVPVEVLKFLCEMAGVNLTVGVISADSTQKEEVVN